MGVWGTDEWMLKESENLNNIKVVLNAYRSIRGNVIYVSAPITSGKLYYELLEKHNVKSMDDLLKNDSKFLVKNIIKPNVETGTNLSDRIAKQTNTPVVSPCVFEARTQEWKENDYMYLWFRVMEEKAKKIVMADDWEYSNGASREFVRAMEMQFGFIKPGNTLINLPEDTDLDKEYQRMRRMKVVDEQNNPLIMSDGINKLSYAIQNLQDKGFDVPMLEQSLCKLYCVCIHAFTHLNKKGEDLPYYYKIDWNDEIVKEQLFKATKRNEELMMKYEPNKKSEDK